jgi:hypothetical protein
LVLENLASRKESRQERVSKGKSPIEQELKCPRDMDGFVVLKNLLTIKFITKLALIFLNGLRGCLGDRFMDIFGAEGRFVFEKITSRIIRIMISEGCSQRKE